MNIDLNNLHWYGWTLLAIGSSLFLGDLASAARYVKRGDVGAGFLLSVSTLTFVLYMLVRP